jgi:hypothetical protein
MARISAKGSCASASRCVRSSSGEVVGRTGGVRRPWSMEAQRGKPTTLLFAGAVDIGAPEPVGDVEGVEAGGRVPHEVGGGQKAELLALHQASQGGADRGFVANQAEEGHAALVVGGECGDADALPISGDFADKAGGVEARGQGVQHCGGSGHAHRSTPWA